MTKTLGQTRRYPRSSAIGHVPWATPTVTPVRHRSTLTELGWWVVAVVLGAAAGFVFGACYLIGSRP